MPTLRTKPLSESQEDYLEAILALEREGAPVAVAAIAARKGVSMPSVNGALKRLERINLVRHGRYDYVQLTPAGRRRAQGVAGRHELLRCFLSEVLGVSEKVAEADACAIEHHLSAATVEALTAFVGRRP